MIKLALVMIVKGTADEAPLLDACLKSVAGHVDGIFLDINTPKGKQVSQNVIEVAKRHNANYKKTVWTGNFVKARNDSFSRIPKNFTHVMWLDTDDTVLNPEKMREVCAIMDKKTNGLYVKYDYAHDEYGNVTITHWVARIVRNNGTYAWKASFADGEKTVHETLNPVRHEAAVANDEFKIIHHADDTRRQRSLKRNIELLENMISKVPENVSPDPRTLYYLATHYVDDNKLAAAKDLFEYYLKLSGWAEERSQAWVYLGMIYDAIGDLDKARGCYLHALAENPNDPNPYVELGELEIKDNLFDKAVYWLEMAVSKKQELTSMVLRPMDSTYRAYKLLSQAYVNTGAKGLNKAQKWLTEARKLRPFDPELEEAQEVLDEVKKTRDLTRATHKILVELKDEKDNKKINTYLDSLPKSLQDNPLVANARSYYREPVKWAEKSITILCGWGPLGNWGPKSLEKGLGGSEEAVIRISKELAKQGFRVTIFGTPGEEAGEHDGVDWRHYWEFNRKDTFDIFISWRNPELLEEPIKAHKSYLWLHDVMDKEEFTDEVIKNTDRIIFVSQYHRDLYPFIPEEKCFVSGNGITPEDFDKLDGKFERDPHKCIYMSSHVRGLELIYRVWPDVIKAVPDATLDVYYGWESYISVNKQNPERMAWMQMMQKYERDLPGVTDHGRVGHDEINEAIFKSGVWLYPCVFPEVYCITAVKAQAGGAVPISTDFAALKETVKYGKILHMEKAPTIKTKEDEANVGYWDEKELEVFKDEIVAMLLSPKEQEKVRPEMMKWARKEMSWRQTATKWSEDFNAK